MCPQTENKVAKSSHSKYRALVEKSMKIAPRSNVTNFQPLLAFNMRHIPTKLHRFLTSSFQDFLQRDTQTDTQTPAKTTPARARSIAGMQVMM